MTPAVLAFAFAAGFTLSIPVGPVSALVIRRTLSRGFAAGLSAGAGVALADAIYGALGAAGATSPFAVAVASGPARIGAGALFVVLGVLVLRSRIDLAGDRTSTLRERAAGFAGTFAVAIVNPGAVPIVAAAFSAARMPALGAAGYPAVFTALFVGALAWWALLAAALLRSRQRVGAAGLRILNVATGGLAVVAGALTIVSALR